jgi:hypothetical protein
LPVACTVIAASAPLLVHEAAFQHVAVDLAECADPGHGLSGDRAPVVDRPVGAVTRSGPPFRPAGR